MLGKADFERGGEWHFVLRKGTREGGGNRSSVHLALRFDRHGRVDRAMTWTDP